MNRLDELRIKQLDEALTPYQSLLQLSPPREGWARAVRTALGMSQRQVAERANVSSTSVRSAEVNEARGTIQLDSLTTLARAMDCDVVYAIVPRASLREILEHRAEQIARDLVDQVSDSMDLESQGVDPAERARQLEDLKAEVLRDRGRNFWDV